MSEHFGATDKTPHQVARAALPEITDADMVRVRAGGDLVAYLENFWKNQI